MPPPAVLAQYLLPKQLLTALAGKVANAEAGATTSALIRRFIDRYGVDMNEAAEPDPAAYPSFNAFFTRALKPGIRPLAHAELVCPVDGAISQFGRIEASADGEGTLLQAKGHTYTTRALLGGDAAMAAAFDGGHFATLYLSPRDYHRIHMPCAGVLKTMLHVPGALFSVNPATAAGVPGLFARNERVVCRFETAYGPLALVLVGATIVGSMATVWHGVVNPPRPGRVRRWDYDGGGHAGGGAVVGGDAREDVHLAQGEEMGRFLLGSTVVLLWPSGPWHFNPAWQPGAAVRLGEAMATRRRA